MVDRLGGCVVVACALSAPSVVHAQARDSVLSREAREAEEQATIASRPTRLLVSNLAALGATTLSVAIPALTDALPRSGWASAVRVHLGVYVSVATLASVGAATTVYWFSAQSIGGRGQLGLTVLGAGIGMLAAVASVAAIDERTPQGAVVPVICMSLTGIIGASLGHELSQPSAQDWASPRQGRRSVRLLPIASASRDGVTLSIGGAL
jgi:hypothetical protein